MAYDLLIRQSYHGEGGKEGYRYKVYNHKKIKIGELQYIPPTCYTGNLVLINEQLYRISNYHDSEKAREINSEVIYYELQRYIPEPDYDLGKIF